MIATPAGKAILLTPQRRYLLRHTFSGASLTPSDLGPALVSQGGTPLVADGVLKMTDATTVNVGIVSLAANVVIQAKVNFATSAATDRRFFLRARDDHAAGSRVEVVISQKGSTVQIVRRDSNSPTSLGSVPYTFTAGVDYWLRFSAVGNRFEALVSTDGQTFASKLVVTDTTYPAVPGIQVVLLENVASPTIQVDDLLVWTS